jgi:two-component system, chemotaxis family, sensor kinase CheA
MANSIFSSQWLEADSKKKKELLENSFLGLKPVLIYIDDEEDALEIFKTRCIQLGIDCYASSCPDDVKDFLSLNKLRTLIIISDFRMPGSNGFDFRQSIEELASDIPFYILSGYVDRELALEGIKYKIAGFIEKPFKVEQLIEILTDAGEKRALQLIDEYEMLKSFTDDVVNITAEIEEHCLTLESDPHDTETIAKVFGLVHTVKGSSGFFDPRTLHLFAHEFEEILKQVQAGVISVTTKLISSWLKANDVVKMLNHEFITGEHQRHNLDELKKILKFAEDSSAPALEKKSNVINKEPKTQEKSNDIKVSMKVLDDFTQVSGELTVIRNMINKVVNSIEKSYPADKDVLVLSELLEEMHKINSDVQNKIADIRRVPASQLVKPLTRNFRDTCRALNKEVDLVVDGESLRLDNAIAEAISRCLIHMMRNSLDHGLEANVDRERAGKPYRGKLHLKFEQRNDFIVVEIIDDGKGIATDKIKEKVLSKGLKTEQELGSMTESELQMLIFESGFSTAQQVTEFSGRGVGMSMVKETIEEMNGKISIDSEVGKGSRFILEIPVPKSVQIINCLFVGCGKMTLGVPQEFIVRVLDEQYLLNEKTDKLDGAEFIRFENKLIPIISLGKTLELDDCEQTLLLILNAKGSMMALRVSDVYDIEDAVIKPLSVQRLKNLGIYMGGTFLGDATVGLVLDVVGLADKLNLKFNKTIQKEITNKIDNQFEEKTIISFDLFKEGAYCVPEEEVFRVEVIERSQFKKSGDNFIMPYRDSILVLLDIDQTIFKTKTHDLNRSNLSCIIIRAKEIYIALSVKAIKDLEKVKYQVIPPLKKHFGIGGSLIVEARTYTVLDVPELISQGSEAELNKLDNLSEAA